MAAPTHQQRLPRPNLRRVQRLVREFRGEHDAGYRETTLVRSTTPAVALRMPSRADNAGRVATRMMIDKGRILDALRRRGQHTRADWVDRTLPDRVDTASNAGLLATLELDPATLSAEPAPTSPTTDGRPDQADN
jgi:hypothetical protein